MIHLEQWINDFSQTMKETFENRVLFIGLQGSYARGEASDDSDIDVVVILDKLTAKDLRDYDLAVSKLTHRELLCGFISGAEELKNWDRADLFQFCYDTVDVYGSLEKLIPKMGKEEANKAILTSACNLYHGCIHNLLHEKDEEILKSLYKSAAFTVRAVYYANYGKYIKETGLLFAQVDWDEKEILKGLVYLKGEERITSAAFQQLSERLLVWAGDLIKAYNGGNEDEIY